MKPIYFFSFFLLLLLASCSYAEDEKIQFEKDSLEFARKNNFKTTNLGEGLLLIEKEKGNGKLKVIATSEVYISYQGMLSNGKIFDERKLDIPLKSMIPGMQVGLLGQAEGSKITLIIPPHLGYEKSESAKIPANSLLIFNIEVIDVR